MDGNGRWATAKNKSRTTGHREGVKVLEDITDFCFELGISCLTVYAFSSENTARPKEEIDGLIRLIKEFFSKKLPKFIKHSIRIVVLGDRNYFDKNVQNIINEAESKTAHFEEKTLAIALNYGARNEIIRAVNKAIDVREKVDENSFSKLLDTKDLLEVDIIIRTGGEKRLSNFLLYQSAYTELFFVNDLWPDFNRERLSEIIAEFKGRSRRFGKVENNIK